jgi:hypothetical protein
MVQCGAADHRQFYARFAMKVLSDRGEQPIQLARLHEIQLAVRKRLQLIPQCVGISLTRA